MLKRTVIAAVLAASAGAAAIPAFAQGAYVAPPPPYEVAPPMRHGYVWVPGHWEWRHGEYYWMQGTWARARHGHYYVPPRWAERDGRWYMDGGWRPGDRDGDGVPNRYDRAPNNPYRY